MTSTTMAPLTRAPTAQPERLRPGSKAWRNTCCRRTRHSARPRLRADSTKGWARASSKDSRVTWLTNPPSGRPIAKAGSTRARRLPLPAGGNQCRPKAKTASRIDQLHLQRAGIGRRRRRRLAMRLQLHPSEQEEQGMQKNGRDQTQHARQRTAPAVVVMQATA